MRSMVRYPFDRGIDRVRTWFCAASLVLLIPCTTLPAGRDPLLKSLHPSGHVNDFAGVMRFADRAETENILTELEQKSGAQVAVVTLKSLDGGQIDDFSTRLFEQWKMGQKGKDNGLLLLAVMDERKVRIETGYGFESVLPDAFAGRLIDQYIVPAFRNGDYSGGLRSGAVALAAVAASASGVELSGVPNPSRYTHAAQGHRGGGILQIIFFVLMVIAIIRHPWLLLFMLSGGGGGGRSRGGGFGGGGFGGFGGGMSGGGGASRGW